MDERDLREPTLREGAMEGKIPEVARQTMSPDTSAILENAAHEMFDDDLTLEQRDLEEKTVPESPSNNAPPVPEGETEESFPKPHLWMQPDDLQQEEVKAQETLMRDVVSTMLSSVDNVTLEGNAASEISLMPAEEISRIEELASEAHHETGLELGLGDV